MRPPLGTVKPLRPWYIEHSLAIVIKNAFEIIFEGSDANDGEDGADDLEVDDH